MVSIIRFVIVIRYNSFVFFLMNLLNQDYECSFDMLSFYTLHSAQKGEIHHMSVD